MRIKNLTIASVAVAGGVIADYTGGWDAGLKMLVIFMCIDYVTGLVCAGIFHKSNKSETGALESRAGFKGLCRKGMIIALVMVAHQADLITGTTIIRNSVIIAFSCNEAISIMENAAMMGLPVPVKLKEAIDILKDKNGDENA